MPLVRRQDAMLLAGLAVALVIIFSASISRLLDYIREIERQSGLSLLPALFVLTGIYVIHQLRKRHEVQAQAAAAVAAKREAEMRAEELERLVAFGHALARTLDDDGIRSGVETHLPKIAGVDNIWILLRRGTQWEALVGDTRGAEEIVERESLAESLIDGAPRLRASDHTAGFPLVVGGAMLGVLGVRPPSGPLPADRHRAVEAAAAILAVSIKNAQLFREVRENSLRDGLTGCATQSHALEVIDGELRRARRSQLPVSIIMFDLDHFKAINDRFGHLCGDAVLAAVGQRMREVLRGSDLKCRYGGEEFLVLLPETPIQGARRVAETLRREIAERPVPWAGQALDVTASFGLAQALVGEIDVEALIGRADAALYRAKEEGRNCVRVSPEVPTRLTEVRKIVAAS